MAKKVIKRALKYIPEERGDCPCSNALENAIITAKDKISQETKEKLKPIIGKYL